LLPYRELDDVLGLTVVAGNSLADAHSAIFNARHGAGSFHPHRRPRQRRRIA
jgi:hypothetical protein